MVEVAASVLQASQQDREIHLTWAVLGKVLRWPLRARFVHLGPTL